MSPERTQTLTTKEILQQRDIRLGIFDLDSTLIRTAYLFNTQRNAYINRVRHLLPTMDDEALRTTFNKAWAMTGEVHSVRHDVTNYTILCFAQLCGISQPGRLLELQQPLLHIYEEIPEIKKGVISTLIQLHDSELPMVILTHAEHEWSYKKMASNFISGFFDKVYAVNVRQRHKLPDDWLQPCIDYGVTPQQTLGVGDNLYSDIIPATQAGIGHVVMIRNYDAEWYQDLSKIPTGTMVIEEMDGLIPALAEAA